MSKITEMQMKIAELLQANEAVITLVEQLTTERDALEIEISTAIGTCAYMDPPDGGNVSLPEQVRRMRADRDALSATVEALRRELQACQNVLHSLAHDGQVTPAYANDAKKVLAATPQQHLAEIKAQAGRDGYLACLTEYVGAIHPDFHGSLANQYADSIRRGEVK